MLAAQSVGPASAAPTPAPKKVPGLKENLAAQSAPAPTPTPNVKGNIDINYRPVVHNIGEDGQPQIQTLYSTSFHDEDTGKEILVPRVVFTDLQGNPITAKAAKALYTKLGVPPKGKVLDARAALQFAKKTGENLGYYDTPDAATKASIDFHDQNAQQYGGGH